MEAEKSATEDPMGRQEMRYLKGPKNHEEGSVEILVLLLTRSRSVKDVMGNVDSLRDEMKGNKKDLEDQMKKRLRESQGRNEPQNGSRVRARRKRKTVSPNYNRCYKERNQKPSKCAVAAQ